MKIVILAGGSGTRLWPKSNDENPKQFNKIIDNKTMIEFTYDRFKDCFSKQDIYISTVPRFVEKINSIFPSFNKANLIVEPEKRDSGPAMGFVASVLAQQFPDEPIAFIPSDHYVQDVKTYIKSIKIGGDLIRETGKMVDIAIPPNFPSTVLGYTRIGEQYKELDGIEIYHFKGHVEKPTYDKAKRYLSAGDYFWHASYYMWTPRLFLEAYKKYAPELFKPLSKIGELMAAGKKDKIADEYSCLPKISIDYAVTEKMKAEDVLIIKGNFGWSDIGAWDVLYDQLSREVDQHGNLVKANYVGVDTSGSLIMGDPEKLIATIGVDDMVIVDTKDALLVCPQSRSQDVKMIVEKLKKQKEEKNGKR